ncbi:alpha-L-rhamnosidase-related protein [Botrimarina hoheduenensis]|nr:alpha-L-rhamnosidase C-terminal domain-containing protein [Botrimarina hoheduenensis]
MFRLSQLPRALCIAFLLVAFKSHAAEGPWQANWIAPTGESETNSWWCFQKTIELPAADAASPAHARIACDSKYWLWINGELRVFEGQLKRGPTPRDTYYDHVDLTGAFRAGKNTLAVLVWHFGKEGMSHKSSGQVGLLFDGAIGAKTLLSDKSWRARRHPAYLSTGEPHPNWRLPESNIGFDARLELANWQTAPTEGDSKWVAASEMGPPPAAPWNKLIPRGVPLLRFSTLQEYENAADLPRISDGKPIVARLPYNAQVTPSLEIEAPAGLTIDLRTDNYRGGSENSVRGEYTTREGKQAYESLGWMNGHAVVYSIPPGVKIHALRYRESGFDTQLTGSFRCNVPALNTLWKKAQRTLYLEMRDNFADCPDRERAQWWGDVTLELQQAFYALDPQCATLARKAILELVGWQRPTGVLHAPVPAGNYDSELPMQMLASVGRQGFWEYYRHTGDRDTMVAVYPAVKSYLALWQLGDDGLVVQRQGDWTWGDWGTNKDLPLLYNAWYYLALEGQRNMAQLCGDSAALPRIDERRARLKSAFNKTFWTGTAYKSPRHEGPFDDRGNALAVVAGLAPPEHTEALAEVLSTNQHASPYMEKYVLEALLRLGHVDSALLRMEERYRPMIDSPVTTLWEGWGVGEAGYGGGSYNHAWGGGPLTLLSQYVAGIDPLEPGYGRIRIAPSLGPLRELECVVDSPRGKIRVDVAQDQSEFRLSLQTPAGVVSEVVIPWCPGALLEADNQVVDIPSLRQGGESRLSSQESKIVGGTITSVGVDSLSLSLGAGAHHLRVKKPPKR